MKYTLEYDQIESNLERYRERLSALLSTTAGTQPMDREFGIDTSGAIGMSPPAAKNTLAVEIIDKIQRYIPEVEVDGIDFEYTADGELKPIIYLTDSDNDEEEDEDDEQGGT